MVLLASAPYPPSSRSRPPMREVAMATRACHSACHNVCWCCADTTKPKPSRFFAGILLKLRANASDWLEVEQNASDWLKTKQNDTSKAFAPAATALLALFPWQQPARVHLTDQQEKGRARPPRAFFTGRWLLARLPACLRIASCFPVVHFSNTHFRSCQRQHKRPQQQQQQ